jgi:hypothetical protein
MDQHQVGVFPAEHRKGAIRSSEIGVLLLLHDDIFPRRKVRDVPKEGVFIGSDVLQDHWKVGLSIGRFQAREFRKKAMNLFFRQLNDSGSLTVGLGASGYLNIERQN